MNRPTEAQRSMYVLLREYLRGKISYVWTTAREISRDLNIAPEVVREICQHYPASFVSSTEGYKVASLATNAEIQHCVTTLISRSEKMLHRASALSGHLA